ncbi:cytochrome c3 family protein [Nitrogeniibacter aestuarii]|uniref:cytochrome c3 family protein n=1 Tax=Nitrogeniibacter aestuarii TaxID=2815343 RepID=UPI001D125C5A|nr:cytochrome c3 family protein [Nitrogeniibacter aestuarii]
MRFELAAVMTITLAVTLAASAEKVSDVRATKHNFSATAVGRTTGQPPQRDVQATGESQVCVFCHTPHGATAGTAPLWNRTLSGQTYTPYTSSSLDAEVLLGRVLDQPAGSSKLCLSCHDGSLAIGNVNVLSGQGGAEGSQSIAMSGTGVGGTMPDGAGETTGFTRRLGIDLRNDHPISLDYTTALATRDGEMRVVDANQQWPADGSVLGVRAPGYKPKLPLEPTGIGGTGQLQCATCHDPHLYDTEEAAKGLQKFLRLNRFQEIPPSNAANPDSDIICLACHDKNTGNGSWAHSAHANPNVADETYKALPAAQRQFPPAQPVWKAACLNCHDTHTVAGARRLLREGTDSPLSPKAGGNPAIEETCYQCHTNSAGAVVVNATGNVPDIQTEFSLARHMPIRSVEQAAGEERHDIDANFTDAGFIDCTGPASQCGKDMLEPRERLGVANTDNRHAECTDCHNPHRIIRSANGLPGVLNAANTSTDQRASHNHAPGHTNIISGALRGAWGVEPVYGDGSFFSLPGSYLVKRGDPGASVNTTASATYVTREYQICLKCHSDYGYTDDNVLPNGVTRPLLGNTTGLTPEDPDGRNNFSRYTNQARELQPNNAINNTGADGAFNTGNHRSWHPVVGPTGRDLGARGNITNSPWLTPWRNDVGTQTMFCSDCHGAETPDGTVVPTGNQPWGPHGSNRKFILKGEWGPGLGGATRDGDPTPNFLCFKCHDPAVYTGRNDSGRRSGFFGGGKGNLHNYHADKVEKIYCSWCHAAVPHGWKNKALLVNLNDVGPEAGYPGSMEVATNGDADNFSEGPYYMRAKLKVRTFAASGNWSDSNCGSAGKATGSRIPASNGNTANDAQTGKDWMIDTCSNPP